MTRHHHTMQHSLTALSTELGQLLQSKNIAYGGAFAFTGELLRLLFPNGIPPDKYKHVALIVRIADKLGRLAAGAGGDVEEPYLDIAGYGIIGTHMARSERPAPQKLEPPAEEPPQTPADFDVTRLQPAPDEHTCPRCLLSKGKDSALCWPCYLANPALQDYELPSCFRGATPREVTEVARRAAEASR